MNQAKKVIWTIAGGMLAGLVLGVLYAPQKGCETRRQLKRLKRKYSFSDEDMENADKETMKELGISLQEQLDIINSRLSEQ